MELILEITDVMICMVKWSISIYQKQYFSRLKLFMGGAFMSQVLELAVFCTGATEGCFLLHWDAGCSPLHTLHA